MGGGACGGAERGLLRHLELRRAAVYPLEGTHTESVILQLAHRGRVEAVEQQPGFSYTPKTFPGGVTARKPAGLYVQLQPDALEAAGSREHPHPPRGGGGVPQSGDAVLDRQGLVGDGPVGHEGLLSGQAAVPAAARRHDVEVPGDDRVSRESTPASNWGSELLVYINEEGRRLGIHPLDDSEKHTEVMKTDALKQALDKYQFDAAFGGARRDEEKSRAKERVYSFRDRNHAWDPKNQRPELWNLYNAKVNKGESIRVFPLSNWTELDVWQYIHLEQIPIVPLYFAAERPVVVRDGVLILVDDDRLQLRPANRPQIKTRPLPHARLLSAHRRGRIQRHHPARDHPGDAADQDLGTAGSPDRPRRGGRGMEEKKKRGYF